MASIILAPSSVKQHPAEQFTVSKENSICQKANAGVNAESGCISTIIRTLHYAISVSAEIDEELKARDQMAWIGLLNIIRQLAKETILYELIYA